MATADTYVRCARAYAKHWCMHATMYNSHSGYKHITKGYAHACRSTSYNYTYNLTCTTVKSAQLIYMPNGTWVRGFSFTPRAPSMWLQWLLRSQENKRTQGSIPVMLYNDQPGSGKWLQTTTCTAVQASASLRRLPSSTAGEAYSG